MATRSSAGRAASPRPAGPQVESNEMSPPRRSVLERLGVFGTTASGAVFALAGCVVVRAAVTYDARKARGLAEARYRRVERSG